MKAMNERNVEHKPTWLGFLLSLCVLTAMGATASGAARVAEGDLCIPIFAKINAQVVQDPASCGGALCTTGEVTGGGILNGTTRFTAFALAPAAGMPGAEPVTTLSYTGELEVTTKHGIIVFSDVGVFDPIAAAFAELDRVVEGLGTGRFYGASGLLFISGPSTPDGLGFDGDITGEICLPQ